MRIIRVFLREQLLHLAQQQSFSQSNVDLMIHRNSYQGKSASDSIGIYASSVEGTDTTTVKNKLNFIVLEYDKLGKLRDIKPFGY